MDKKRPLGVKLFLLSFLYFWGVLISHSFISLPGSSLIVKNEPSTVDHQRLFFMHDITAVIQIALLTVLIIGIFFLSRWGFCMLFAGAIATIIHIIHHSFLFKQYSQEVLHKQFSFLPAFMIAAYLVITLIYFLQPRIRRIFLTSNEAQEDTAGDWSALLLVLVFFIIYTEGLAILSLIKYDEIVFGLKALAFGWLYYLINLISAASLLTKKDNLRKIFIGICCYAIFIKIIKMTNPVIMIESVIYQIVFIFIVTRPEIKKLFI